MKNEFALAFNEVLEDKQLPREVIIEALQTAMVQAYRRAVSASAAQGVEASIDTDTGKVTILAEKEVVEDIQDDRTEVLLEEARKVDPNCQLGDMVMVESTPTGFGRVAALAARQSMQTHIRDAERNAQKEYFTRQQGEIVSGLVQTSNNQGTTLQLDMKAEGILPANQKIPGEKYRLHERVRAVVLEVKDSGRGPQVILSRAHRNYLRRLLENEVPEIYHGIVEIRAIAREPGQRAKVAVSATQAGVDPVGACVGVRGQRIQAIVRELHEEKIDIIEWNADSVVYISKAISPARVNGVYLKDGDKTATVVVQEDQLSLAIGRDGQNARLAAKLTGWRIDIKSIVEAASDTLAKLQRDPNFAVTAEAEVEHVPQIEEILAKKAEGRPVTPEEYTRLSQFVERVERRTAERQLAEEKAEQERVDALRAEIPAQAFEIPLAELGLQDHVYTIVSAEYPTVGELMMTMKGEPDKVLGLAGIGPKSMQAIEKAIVEFSVPAPTVEVEPAPAESPEEEAPAEEVPAEASAEVALAAEGQAEAEAPAEGIAEPEAKEELEPSLEQLFTLSPESLRPASSEEADEEGKKDKKGKKGKKTDVTLVFDEERGQVVGRKKHKRGGGWSEEE
jgi:transcription termination/antitermination protein NusA